MLTHLQVKNFAIIDRVEIELGPGLTVLTGETGAGKSILVDALGLALGDRADSTSVRSGSRRADITASFDVTNNPAALAWLAEQELEVEDECVIRRSVSADGRSSAFVNGVKLSLQALRELADRLVEIHGQHAHQSLGRPGMQREIVDTAGGHEALLAVVAETFAEWSALGERIDRLTRDDEERAARIDLLRYQLEELKQLALESGEYERLEEEHRRLANVDRLLQGAQAALGTLYAGDEATGHMLVVAARRHLEQLEDTDAALVGPRALLEGAEIQIREAADALTAYLADLELDPGRLAAVGDRIAAVQQLARKHRIEPQDLHARAGEIAGQLQTLTTADEQLDELRARLAAAEKRFSEHAGRLSAARTEAAGELAEGVTAWMQRLGMPGGRLAIEVTPRPDGAYGRTGLDRVQFRVSANPGQALLPLAKVASGGELSRIALAIRVVAAAATTMPTMVFDEVDTGVGGGVAEMVGRCLRALGAERQVLCVTHLPQVASQGHAHVRISKVTDGRTTRTAIHPLSDDESVEELARMLGGVEITETTRSHAREMLYRGRKQA